MTKGRPEMACVLNPFAATATSGGNQAMTTSQQDEFLHTALGNSDALTPEQAAQLLELGIPGDTGAKPDTSSVPGAAADEAGKQAGAAGSEAKNTGDQSAGAQTEDHLNADNAVIQAKDGKHTISYDKLVEARTTAQQATAALAEANRLLAELRAQAQVRTEAGQAATETDSQLGAAQAAIDAGADPSIFGDFSEEAMAKGIAKLVQQQVDAQVAQRMAQIDEKLKPIETQRIEDSTSKHYSAIYEKHPDADSLVESQQFDEWMKSQPSVARSAYAAVLEKGSTAQVIEVFDAFKQATGGTQAAAGATPTGDVQAAARAAVASAATKPPASLSDIPGGRPSGETREQQLAQMDAPDLLTSMENMTPAQIEAFLNRQI